MNIEHINSNKKPFVSIYVGDRAWKQASEGSFSED